MVVPFYNRLRFLDDAIRSVIDQSYRPIEVILVDDGSTEQASLPTQWEDVSLRIFRNTENQGPAASRFLGLRHSRGGYVLFLDSDDKLDSQCIEKLTRKIHKHADLAFVYGYTMQFDETGKTWERKGLQQAVHSILPNLLLDKRTWHTSSCLWSRHVLGQIKPFGGRIWEDYRLDFEAALISNHIDCVPEFLCFAREHAQGRASDNPDKAASKAQSIEGMLERLSERGINFPDRDILFDKLHAEYLACVLQLDQMRFREKSDRFFQQADGGFVSWLFRTQPLKLQRYWVDLRRRTLLKRSQSSAANHLSRKSLVS
ncbi:MAG: glycosyltransferase family 2 protein [Cyclobacteriaceae bacterium]